MEGSAVPFELREHDRRISALHKTVGGLSTDLGGNKTDIKILQRDVKDVEGDVADLKDAIEKEGEKNRKALLAATEKYEKAQKESDDKYRGTSNRLLAVVFALVLSAAGSALTFALSTGGHP
jgi:ParB-like chromosome segregation protein Spo0J